MTSSERRDVGLAWLRVVVAAVSRTVLLSLVIGIFISSAPALIGWRVDTVMTGSMTPRIQPGDIAVSMPVSTTATLKTGKVILFKDPDHPGRLRFHRYVGTTSAGLLATRGDANPAADSTPIRRSAVVGVGVIRVPWLGLGAVWIANQQWAQLAAAAGILSLLVLGCFADSDLRHGDRVRTQREREENADAPDPLDPAPSSRRSGGIPRHRRRLGMARLLSRSATGALGVLVVAALATASITAGGSSSAFAVTAANTADQFASCTYYTAPTATTPTIGGVAPEFFAQLGEGTGTTTANTGSKPANTTSSSFVPTLGTGTTWNPTCTDRSTSVHFDGTSNATISTPYYAANSYTSLAVWIRTTSTTGGRIAGQDVTTASGSVGVGTSKALYLGANGRIGFFVRKWASGTSTYYNVTSTTAVNDGNWHLIEVEQNNGSMIMEIDAGTEFQASAPTADNYTSSSSPAYWNLGAGSLTGASLATTSTSFVGDIDKVSISEQNFSNQAEATAMYNAGH